MNTLSVISKKLRFLPTSLMCKCIYTQNSVIIIVRKVVFRSGRGFITRCDGILEQCYEGRPIVLRQCSVTAEKSVHAVYKGSESQNYTEVIFLFRLALPELKNSLA